MTLKARFALLLGALLLTFIVGLFLLQHVEQREQREARETLQGERSATLDLWLELSGRTVRQLAQDYSLWDETVEFVRHPSAEWARINLAPSLNTFSADALWVLGPDGELIHHEHDLSDGPLPPPLSPAQLEALILREPFAGFFHGDAPLLLEVRLAPIQPSADMDRTTPPVGWLLVARQWDEALLEELGRMTESTAQIAKPGLEIAPSNPSMMRIQRALLDWQDQPLGLLLVDRSVADLNTRLAARAPGLQIFAAFGLGVITLLGLAFNTWVVRPLIAIEQSLRTNQLDPIARLQTEPNELGRLARLVEHSFGQRRELVREVEERARIEEALRLSEANLRQAIEERVRLGRDLHDSIIQSVYAAGLSLASIRPLLATDPVLAEQRLERVRQRLNETIRDLRNFITGLEPEAIRQFNLQEAVLALVDFLQTAAPIHVEVAIDEALVERLPVDTRADLLQIIREGLSNVLRHANAQNATVSFQRDNSHAVLQITDDGRGFQPVDPPRGTGGLANLSQRAQAAGATLDLDTAVGKGTRLRVRFPLTRQAA